MLSSISLRHMRAFVAIADHGSFSAAASVLGLTPPALTSTIRQFEELTGAALFDRTTRQVSLTETGERFLPVARRLIGDFEEALDDLDALSKGGGGTIRIAAAPSVLTRILPAVISRFLATYPDTRLRLDERNAGEVHEAVANNEADFGIAGDWQSLPDIVFNPLFSDRFGVLCRSDHPFARQAEVAWSQLADHPFVGLGPESGTRAMMAGSTDGWERSSATGGASATGGEGSRNNRNRAGATGRAGGAGGMEKPGTAGTGGMTSAAGGGGSAGAAGPAGTTAPGRMDLDTSSGGMATELAGADTPATAAIRPGEISPSPDGTGPDDSADLNLNATSDAALNTSTGKAGGGSFVTPSLARAAALGVTGAEKALKRAGQLDRALVQIEKQRLARAGMGAGAAGGDRALAATHLPENLVAHLRPVVETSNTITLATMVAEGVGITVLPELAARIATGVSGSAASGSATTTGSAGADGSTGRTGTTDTTGTTGIADENPAAGAFATSGSPGHPAISGRLVFVPLCQPVRKRTIGLITRKSKSLSPSARLFLAMVLEQAPQMKLPAALEWYETEIPALP